jgi:hypothetical protein
LAKLIEIEQPKIDPTKSSAEYQKWLDDFLKDNKVAVLPYPDITPKQLVLKSYENVKPFKEGGEGHKDFLIWEVIKDHINGQAAKPPFIFLNSNTEDFCEIKKGKSVLHPDLASQLSDKKNAPTVYTSAWAFFNDVLSPLLEGVSINQVPHLNEAEIDSRVIGILDSEIAGYSAYGFEGVPFVNEVYAAVVGSATIENRELKKIDDEIVITVTGTVPIEVEGYMDKHSYYSEENFENVYVSDPDWNDHVMAVSATVDTAFEVKLYYSPADKEVSGHDLTLLQEIQDDYPYK